MSETVHATALVAGAQGVLIRGASGAGKSTLAAQLIAAGARLVADDRVHLSARDGRIVASAPAAISGMLELCGRGIVGARHERSTVVRLVVDLLPPESIERMPEGVDLKVEILGVALPRQPAPTGSERALVLVQAALRAL